MKCAKLILLIMICGASVFGAAEEYKKYPTTATRLIALMTIANVPDLLEHSPVLFQGIQHIFGVGGMQRSTRKAKGCFLFARETAPFFDIVEKANLYLALLDFMSAETVARSYEKSFERARAVLASKQSAVPDRIRAYLLMDEIWHTPGSGVPFNIISAEAHFTHLLELPYSNDSIYEELYFRRVRNFICHGGLNDRHNICCAIMGLNILLRSGHSQNQLLKKDVSDLKADVLKVLTGEKGHGGELGLGFMAEFSEPREYIGNPFKDFPSPNLLSDDDDSDL